MLPFSVILFGFHISPLRTSHLAVRGFFVKVLANSTKMCYTYDKLLTRTGTSKVIFGYNGRDGVVTEDNGLIYMRARYYSPDMKRFVNADIVAGQISNAITLNRFAYANGNPVALIDPFGLSPERGQTICTGPVMHLLPVNKYTRPSKFYPTIFGAYGADVKNAPIEYTTGDAIWLQYRDGAGSLGHTGLLLQDEDGMWYLFYWGSDNIRDAILGKDTGVHDKNKVLQEVYRHNFDLDNLYNDVINLLNSKRGDTAWSKDITDVVYIKGDFTKSKEYIQHLIDDNVQYNLYYNNCMQVSAAALIHGTFDYHDNECKLALFNAIDSCIPNIAYDYFVAPKARAFIGQDNHDYTPHFISHSKSFSVKY